MDATRWLWRRAGAAGAAALGLAVLAACGSGGGSGPGGSDRDDAARHPSRSFTVPGKRLTVRAGNSPVQLVATRGAKTTVQPPADDEDRKPSWSLHGSTLTLDAKCGGSDCRNRRFRVAVPARLALHVHADHGTVDAEGFTRALRVDGGDGTVSAHAATGDVHVTTRGGDIAVHDLTGGAVLSSRGGAVDAERVHGTLRADSSTGSVRAEACGDATLSSRDEEIVAVKMRGAVTATSHRGTVTVQGARGAVRLSSGDGDIDASDLRGRARAETTGGTVNLHFTKAPGGVAAHSRNGSVLIELPDDGRRYRVTGSSRHGERTVHVPRGGGDAPVLDLSSGGDVVVRT